MTDEIRHLKDCIAAILDQSEAAVARSRYLREHVKDPYQLGIAANLELNCRDMQRLLVEVGKELSRLAILPEWPARDAQEKD